jgi:DNA-binding MarR family transcriptional regulator
MDRTPEPHDVLVAFLLLHRTLQRQADVFFAEFGLSDAQFNILNLLAANGGSMDQLALAEKLVVGKSSTSIVLNRMAKAGLVERREHHKDRRQSVLSISAKGHRLWSKISPRYEQTVREVFGNLPKGRRRPFVADLETLYASLLGKSQVKAEPILKKIVQKLQSQS